MIGYGKSIWAMIDTVTRQPVDILNIRDGLILQYVDVLTPCPIEKGSRVKISNEAKCVRSITTTYSDVDMNGHINSVKYIEHVLDLWSLDWYEQYRIKRFDIAYVAESHCGDVLNFYLEEEKEHTYAVRITKSNELTTKEIGVVRCKLVFIKN